MHMKSAQTIRAKLRKLDAKYWTDYRIAKHLEISQSQLKQLLTETKNPSGKTIVALIELAIHYGKFDFSEIYEAVKGDLAKLPKIERGERKVD